MALERQLYEHLIWDLAGNYGTSMLKFRHGNADSIGLLNKLLFAKSAAQVHAVIL